MRGETILFLAAGVACGSPGEATDPARIEVPVQPPQPMATVAPAAPDVDASAGPTAGPRFMCEAPGVPLATNGHAYCAYADLQSWPDAEKRCVDRGGHLLALPTKEASDQARTTFGNALGVKARGAWVGLEAVNKKSKTWKWSTGESVKFERWNEGEPNDWDGHESCGELLFVNGKWNDTRCNLEQGFICQRQAGQASKPLDCNGGRPLATPADKYCYVDTPTNFAQAKKSCAQRGGTLASLTSDEVSKEVLGSLEQRFRVPRFWLGLNDLAEQGTWAWSNGARFQRAFWKPGEPNDFGREGCAELWSDVWQWNDYDCNATLPSVCEAPASAKP